jgi:DNA-directed RNA polymerase subunit RPC12/RpoP
MSSQKVFISGKSEALIVCQKCGQTKTISADPADVGGKTAQIRCKNCGNSFKVVFETRSRYRKDTSLEGHFLRKDKGGDDFGHMVVHDLSMGGMRFEPTGRTVFRVGDLLTIDFRLDDENKSMIRISAIVKSIGERDIGVEFMNLDEHTRKTLGFYLMP